MASELLNKVILNPLDPDIFLEFSEYLEKANLHKESKEAKKIYSFLKLASNPLNKHVLVELGYILSENTKEISKHFYISGIILEPFNYQLLYNLSNLVEDIRISELFLISSTILGVYSIWPWTKLARILIEKGLILEGLRAFYIACKNYEPVLDTEEGGIKDLIDFLDELLNLSLNYSESLKLFRTLNQIKENKKFLTDFLKQYHELAFKFYKIQNEYLSENYYEFLEKYKLAVIRIWGKVYPDVLYIIENFRGDFLYSLREYNYSNNHKINSVIELKNFHRKLKEKTLILYLVGVKNQVLVLGIDKELSVKKKDYLPLRLDNLKLQDEVPFIKKLLSTFASTVDPGFLLKKLLEIFYDTVKVLDTTFQLENQKLTLREKRKFEKNLKQIFDHIGQYLGENIDNWKDFLFKIWNINTNNLNNQVYKELLNKFELVVSLLFEDLGKFFLTLKKNNYQRIFLVPMGTIVNFPIHIMKLSNSKYLVEEFEISYLPPLKVKKNKENKKFVKEIGLISGDSETSKTYLRKFFENLKESLSNQSFNVEEIDITEAENYKILNIVAHGKINLKNPKESFLKIRDKSYKVSDLISVLKANEYALIPSCQVGFSDKVVFDINAGIPAVFFIKGYKGVLVSLVDTLIGDELKDFLVGINQHLLDGKSLGEAYRLSSLRFIKNKEKVNLWRIFTPYEYP